MKVSIYRYNPDTDREPSMKEYEVDTQGKDLMVLDVLNLVKEQDPSMAYRRSCREGVCGSDGMNINGKNGLACITPLSEVAPGVKEGKKPLVLRPLPGLPVIRDLVVDMTMFYNQYEKVQPYLQNDTPAPLTSSKYEYAASLTKRLSDISGIRIRTSTPRSAASFVSDSAPTSAPSSRYAPPVGVSMQPRICSIVDLPLPEGPTIATCSP